MLYLPPRAVISVLPAALHAPSHASSSTFPSWINDPSSSGNSLQSTHPSLSSTPPSICDALASFFHLRSSYFQCLFCACPSSWNASGSACRTLLLECFFVQPVVVGDHFLAFCFHILDDRRFRFGCLGLYAFVSPFFGLWSSICHFR